MSSNPRLVDALSIIIRNLTNYDNESTSVWFGPSTRTLPPVD